MSHVRHFLTVGERQLHFRHAGDGPPLVLLHACPKSSLEQVPLLERLAGRFSCFAFDIAGYGDSDPLDKARPEIPDFADDLARALDALGIESCSVYGRHTGGLIALEFGQRFPGRLHSAIFDGFPVFSDEERRRFLGGYLQPLQALWDGLHLPGLWARMRENYLFFPWNEGPVPANRNDIDMPPPQQLHAVAVDLLKVMDRWRVGYASAFRYRPQAVLASFGLPALIMARRDDLLFPHLERLPELAPNLSIEAHSYDVEAWAGRIERFFAETARGAPAAPPPETLSLEGRIWSRTVPVNGARMRVRCRGQGRASVLILHDVPGSSGQEAQLMHALPAGLPVISPDLPGIGLSDALREPRGTALLDSLANFAADNLAPGATIVARGFAAAAGIALAGRTGARLCLVRPLFPPPGMDAAVFSERYIPAIRPEDDGTHLTKQWYAARDGELYWPWFERTRRTMRWGERRLDPEHLNTRVVAFAENMTGCAILVGALADLASSTAPVQVESAVILAESDPIGATMAQEAARRAGEAPRVVEIDSTEGAVKEAVAAHLL